ncbi:hypothetical protein CBM2609_U20014 [Cupriavidus taiwanensis]|nr:hypothetical protein CBM2604_U20016 [Cupriavidus taiwanensis]SOZ34514.1 hypothetical protein CBM2609_U20014 [Cupriavidus taiwanensis]
MCYPCPRTGVTHVSGLYMRERGGGEGGRINEVSRINTCAPTSSRQSGDERSFKSLPILALAASLHTGFVAASWRPGLAARMD